LVETLVALGPASERREMTMRVLIATASRHGATEEIAATIAATLRERDFDVTASRVEDASDIEDFDGVILGSAVYMGKWLEPARAFVDAHAEELATRRLWLFSSGPLGDPAKPDDEHAVDVHDVLDLIGPCEHRVFSGRLDRDRLGFGERTVTRLVHAPSGDFRDWSSIRAWANAIASSLLCVRDRTPT
jgi:menaquinone-dependent protoporphyrinogen oxidase